MAQRSQRGEAGGDLSHMTPKPESSSFLSEFSSRTKQGMNSGFMSIVTLPQTPENSCPVCLERDRGLGGALWELEQMGIMGSGGTPYLNYRSICFTGRFPFLEAVSSVHSGLHIKKVSW